ncbi:phosphoadenylyl-sulfate reductase [Hahella aquimaris]|uniref:phosphoadenylyl-sulfate reductase n=1 Tax=Hahella sp. HNIBRBA332 TaxID=3015983 RepID=UPI00273AD74D|nr:phosphoadenylyl-sulfate reductase [Hahella sp. HNIBRBA332]WLQ15762.1 phosphoadenylyl-sulfate reductase [Hahella sp. HNIBRBA332]
MNSAQLITRIGDNSAGLSYEAIADLNASYAPLDFEARIRRLYQDFAPEKVLVTSSFAATSAYFLHIISRIRPSQRIHFIDTQFHFKETLEYRDYLTRLYGLDVEDVKPDRHHHAYSVSERLWETDPDLCCTVNKVQPLEEVKENYDIWVSSLMSWQTEHRAGLQIFEERRGIIKFNPMIDVTREERDAYIRDHDLPFHPLVSEGYSSIGCEHCTRKGEERAGRWQGKEKTECGLHL